MPRVAAVVSAGGADLRPGAATWWYPHHTLPAGTYLELSGYDPSFSDWVYVRTTDGTSTGWAQITDLEINRELSSLPRITPVPTLMPTPQPTPTPHTPPLTLTLSAECESGPLRVRAWDLRKVRTPNDWTVTIFIEGQGGNCVYTYVWEGEVKGELMSGPLTFDVKSTDRHAIIIGTASVTSAGETIEVGLFLKPPDGDD